MQIVPKVAILYITVSHSRKLIYQDKKIRKKKSEEVMHTVRPSSFSLMFSIDLIVICILRSFIIKSSCTLGYTPWSCHLCTLLTASNLCCVGV